MILGLQGLESDNLEKHEFSREGCGILFILGAKICRFDKDRTL